MIFRKLSNFVSFPTSLKQTRRLRWAAVGVGSLSLVGMMTAFALPPTSSNEVELETVLEQLATSPVVLSNENGSSYLREEFVRSSDTISSLLLRLGIADKAALEFIKHDQTASLVSRQLRPGKIVTAKTGAAGNLMTLYFPLNGKDSMLVIEKNEKGFSASKETITLEVHNVLKYGTIQSSLFEATDTVGIPDSIAVQLAEIFSAEIDFYRDLRKGDQFSLVYETLSHRGQVIRSGRILSAEFVNNKKAHTAYWFQTEDGKVGYYTADGKSLKKAFLRSPLEFSRVTSGFSNARLHPVLNIVRAHKGIDYGAPIGTKVRAVADATVEFAGHQGGYGNMIVLKHQGSYSTVYGHLNGFAAGLKKGTKISQGDAIGYVGQTGLASGPHLHYEFRVKSQQVNPLAVSLPSATPLNSSQISLFQAAKNPLHAQMNLAKQIDFTSVE